MSAGSKWMVYVVAAVVALVIGFFLWRMMQPDGATTAKISPSDYVSEFAQPGIDHVLIDVRNPDEYASGAIPGSINIPVTQISQRTDEIPDNMPVVLYCRSGNRSNQAASMLAKAGYEEIYDLGGIIKWQAAGLPVE